MRLLVLHILGLIMVTATVGAYGASDYISNPPPTIYQDPAIGPQNMDFDQANNMFIAHPGWLNDRLIHYYKFRMYTPMTYPSKVPMQGSPSIPVAPLYLPTTVAGDFSKLIPDQKPIIRWHTADGEDYSDFVQVYWVLVGSEYLANTYKSYGDLLENVPPASIVLSDVYANLPVVPTGSKLQDPVALGTTPSPIKPLMVWYRGVEVQTFLFETTSQELADHYNPITREGNAGTQGSGYEISVSQFVNSGSVASIPIFHLNQYSMGVVTGQNHGGPWNAGGKNIIGLDREDPGYSPLWQVLWVSRTPINYVADMTSNPAQLTEANGFKVDATPMFVNCPNVGPHGGGTVNPKKASSFTHSLSQNEAFTLAGSLVMEADKTVRVFLGENELASAKTNMLGGFVFTLSANELPDGSSTLTVKDASGQVIQNFVLTKSGNTIFGILPIVPTVIFVAVALAAAIGFVAYRRDKTRRRRSVESPR